MVKKTKKLEDRTQQALLINGWALKEDIGKQALIVMQPDELPSDSKDWPSHAEPALQSNGNTYELSQEPLASRTS